MTDLTDLSYEITGLVNGTEYFVQVFAVNDAGDSAASAQTVGHAGDPSGRAGKM